MKSTKPTSQTPYFVHDRHDGVMFFSDEQEALDYAKDLIENYIDDGCWHEEVEYIQVGKTTHHVINKNVKYSADIDDCTCDKVIAPLSEEGEAFQENFK